MFMKRVPFAKVEDPVYVHTCVNFYALSSRIKNISGEDIRIIQQSLAEWSDEWYAVATAQIKKRSVP